MDELIFPPSPNWYLPNILCSREDGSVAYGAKNNIAIFLSKENKKPELVVVKNAHSRRVTAVAFSPSKCMESMQNTIVSGSEDGFVKLWKIDTLSATIGHKCHLDHKDEVSQIISLDWSTANPHYIISAGDNHSIVLWDIISNSTMKFIFQKLHTTVISCCPYNEKIVAVGGKSGHVFVVKLTGCGEIIYKLRGHDIKINSLSWCPIPYNVFKVDELCEEFLLASACQNKEIYLWRVGSDGKCETNFKIPTSALFKKDGQHHGKIGNSFSFSPLLWLEPYKIYTSSGFGELFYFDIKLLLSNKISNGTEAKQISNCIKLGHDFHTKGLFAIAGSSVKENIVLHTVKNIESELSIPMQVKNISVIKKFESECKKDLKWEVIVPECTSLLWTAGQDRKLLACEMQSSKMEVAFYYHTLCGFVYCTIPSPHDPNKIAIGVGDGMIRLWNLTEPWGNMQIFWQKIKDKVMALDWHPVKDGILAYGTSEGRVGLIDTKTNKLPNVFKPHNPNSINRLAWGPKFSSENEKELASHSEFDLYCIGGKILSLFNPLKLNSDPINLSKLIPFPCKKQTDVFWKPDFSLMAVGNEDGSICLVEPIHFNIVYTVLAYKKFIQSICWHPQSTSTDVGLSPFSGYFTSGSADNSYEIRVFDYKKNEALVTTVDLVATLKGHNGQIKSVAWSPHIGGHLVSSSIDGSVQIWNVITQVPLVNFCPNQVPIFSIWSPVDPDFILTGCKYDVLYVWKISSQNTISPQSNKLKSKKKEKPVQISLSNEIGVNESQAKQHQNSSETAVAPVAEKHKESNIFSKMWKGSSNDEFKKCYSLLTTKGGKEDKNYSLPFLCDENYFRESIKVEEESHRKANNWNEYCELLLWNGNIKEFLNERIVSGHLNDFLVSLAPVVSPRVWHEACLSYSKTLAEKKMFRKAATYLIVCHKVYDAINMLVDARLYLEALCIARSRLPISDPVIEDIVRKYAKWLFETGSYLKACECYIYLEDYLEAAKVLGKKNQPEYLSLAALAAKNCGSLDLECLEATNAVLKCFETSNFTLAEQICEDHPHLQHLRLLLFIYSTIDQLHQGKMSLGTDFISFAKESFNYKSVTFPSIVPKLFHKYTLYRDLKQVHSIVAQELSLAVCAKTSEETMIHITKALCTCCRYVQTGPDKVHPLYKLCHWLAPQGFFTENSLFTVKTSSYPLIKKSIRAFLGAALARHLSDNRDTENLLKTLEFLYQMREDLLDADSYKYFQNLIAVEVCEKRLLKNRLELQNRKSLVFEKVNEETSQKLEIENIRKLSHRENDRSGIQEDDSIDIESGNLDLDEQDSETMTTIKSIKTDLDQTSPEKKFEVKGYIESELEPKIASDSELLKLLKTEIEKFEESRISSPNPVPVYFTLKKLCEEVTRSDSASALLQYLDQKWRELNV